MHQLLLCVHLLGHSPLIHFFLQITFSLQTQIRAEATPVCVLDRCQVSLKHCCETYTSKCNASVKSG